MRKILRMLYIFVKKIEKFFRGFFFGATGMFSDEIFHVVCFFVKLNFNLLCILS